jgi:protein-disulfide isomerase
MKRCLLILAILTPAIALGQSTGSTPPPPAVAAQSAPGQSSAAIQKKVEEYLRHLYAWGPSFKIKFGATKDAPIAGLYEFTVEVTMGDQSDTGVFYASKDGRYLIRGDIQDMSTDPLAVVRAQINLSDNPAKGPANATITIVEYGDFQCPSCRELHNVLREIEPQYPQIRLVFKDFPLTQIHPWAMTAATAGRCAYQQNPAAFWKMNDAIYDAQDLISTENVWQKLIALGAQAGLDTAALRTCMSDPATGEIINATIKEGLQLKIANTPTVFVNGRRLIGPDRATLEQFLQYELAAHPAPTSALNPK